LIAGDLEVGKPADSL